MLRHLYFCAPENLKTPPILLSDSPFPFKNLAQINQEFLRRLGPIWESGELQAILKQIWEEVLGKKQMFPFPNEYELTENQGLWLQNILKRLETNEPLQYILEKAYFLNFEIKVNASVLIPRPETEELVLWVLETKSQEEKSVLDLCTGSGCIALALAKLGKWKNVSGLDVSHSALEIARQNEIALELSISWLESNLLQQKFPSDSKWDIMVSNPPYVLEEEASLMDAHVLQFEPAIALFVPINDPLLFYKKIVFLATQHLNNGGILFFELNPIFALEVKSLMENYGFQDVEIKQDMFGKNRMARGIWSFS